MSVGAQPDDAFLLQQVVLKLKGIKRPDYWTDVADVDTPGYEEENMAEALKGDTPLLHIWWEGDIQSGAMEDSSKLRPIMRLLIMGVAKLPRGVQLALLSLKDDVRNVMLSNSWDPVGIYTRQSPGFPIIPYYSGTGTQEIASFKSMWDILYRAPFPKS